MNRKGIAAIVVAIIAIAFGFMLQSPEITEQPKYPGAPGDSWCDANFTKRIDMCVNNTAGSLLTEYSISLDLSSNPINETSMRIYNSSSSTLRSHWCSAITAGNCTNVWVMYDSVAGSTWTNNTAIYYDNSSANSIGNAFTTFTLHENWDDNILDTSKWTLYYAVGGTNFTETNQELKYNGTPNATAYAAFLSAYTSERMGFVYNIHFKAPTTIATSRDILIRVDADSINFIEISVQTDGYRLEKVENNLQPPGSVVGPVALFGDESTAFHVAKIKFNNDTNVAEAWIDSTYIGNITVNMSTFPSQWRIINWCNGLFGEAIDRRFDAIYWRNYISPEPSATLGSEEDMYATTPVISNVINGSISSTSQYIDWDVSQTAHNRVVYDSGAVYADSTSCTGTWDGTQVCALAYDEDWATYAESTGVGTSIVTFDCAVPTGANRSLSLWHVKDEVGETNLTIPSACWGATLYLRATSNDPANDVAWECDNGPGWTDLRSEAGGNKIYEQAMLFKHTSAWDNSTNVPNITLSGLTASTAYDFQAWSYNTTNTSLSDNSSTLSFTTTAEAPSTNPITISANSRALFCNWSANTTFANIATNLTNCTDFFVYNSTTQRWTFYNINRTINADTFIDEHAAIFVHFNQTTNIACEVLAAETITIPANVYYFTPLRESTAKTLTEINTSIASDGCVVSELCAWNSTAGAYTDTGAYSVDPNEGFAIYATSGCSWDGSV